MSVETTRLLQTDHVLSNGREIAIQLLAETGVTQNGETSIGQPKVKDVANVRQCRQQNGASIAEAAEKFGISTASVKRYAGNFASTQSKTIDCEDKPMGPTN